ncbi:hypothetical protein N9T25_01965 [Candidatus Pelagibacter sp.]|nr:hypothetical protein [Candidatus Pelagibacter sp.]
MKRLLLIVILTFSFQTLSKADDIRDFEIEGMSIGDSLLNSYSRNQIIENIDPNVLKDTDGKFKTTGFYGLFNEYDGIQFTFKSNDKKYIIYGISAGIFYSNIKQCEKKLKSTASKVLKKSNLFIWTGTNVLIL